MPRSLAGTHWKCTNQTLPQHGMTATITDGDIDPDWEGQNEITVQFQNGKTGYMTLRRLQADFKQVIPPIPSNITYLSRRVHAGNREVRR